ncbi:YciI family protein [Cryobacterium sp. BB307]|uniref:YciI family protein n=1 Tax=Cryobacterium sp. BB307 TaxID=2716317 RepID=UPI001445504B|nr:YciI family protein [Cryobacterium sp. BB307]
MKFMIMVFGDEADLREKSPGWIERVTAFMAQFDDEIAQTGELVYSEVLEFGSKATLVDRHGGLHAGTFSGTTKPLARFWVVTVPDETRALELAGRVAEAVESAVEVRQVMEGSQRP